MTTGRTEQEIARNHISHEITNTLKLREDFPQVNSFET